MSSKKDSGKGIIINRMYAGSYLSENIGHEAINLIRADNDGFYLYVNPYGSVSKEALEFDNMLLVRLAGKNLFEVIGVATGLKPAFRVTNPGKQTQKEFNDTLQAQKNYINTHEEGVTYGNVNIIDIFGTASLQDIYITFKATNVKEPKEGQRIFLYYNKEKINKSDYSHLPGLVIELNQHSWPRTALKTYITPTLPKLNDRSDYEKLITELIENSSIWKDKPVEKLKSISATNRETVSLFTICNIQDNENCISNALVYFMTQPKYREIWKEFFKMISDLDLSDNFQVCREVDAKIKGDENTGGRIDILIIDDKNTIVIENKIKSDINTISKDKSDKSQLDRYFQYINKSQEYKATNHCFCILYPNYNLPKIKGEMDNLYKKIPYSNLYDYLNRKGIKELVDGDSNFKALRDLLKRHCSDTPNGYLRDEMLEKFYNRIKELKNK